jgi:GDP-L-fucose synthase
MKILVTGGTSMLGKHLQKYVPDAVYLSSKDCNLLEYKDTINILQEVQPDVVIHMAAKVGGIKANLENPVGFYEDNIIMNTNIVKASFNAGIDRLVGVLSTCAYPNRVSTYPMVEEDFHTGPPTESNLGYGYSKRMLAIHIDAYNKQHNTKYQYIFPSNLYSEYDNKPESQSHYVNALIHKIIEAEKKGITSIELWGDGTPLRQCTYADDVAIVIKKIIEENIYDSFNISNPRNYSIDTIAKIALETLGKHDWDIVYTNPHMNGQYRKDVSIDKLLTHLPDMEFTPLNEGIKIIYNKIKNNTNE